VTPAENGADQADAAVYADPTIAETLRLEQRLRDKG
jgi:hypothetical protein